MDNILTYKYYDTPEGQDIWKKTFVMSKYAALSGMGVGVFDVLMFSHPKGFVSTVGRFGFYVGPLVGMATAFAVTTNVAQNIRGKNDKINYFLGGSAAASIFSAWARSLTIFVPMAAVLGAAAIVKKTSIEEGWEFFPDTSTASRTIKSVRHDWTMVEDPKEYKSWTTGK